VTTVGVVGPGRVGTLLAVGLARASYRVVGVTGGSEEARARVGSLVAGVRSVGTSTELAGRAELLVLAVPDDALEGVVTELALEGGLTDAHRIVHVAGSRGLEVLARASLAGAGTAACHPAMTVPRGSSDPQLLVGAAWAVSADPRDRGWAHRFVRDLGGDPHDLPDDRRALYHAGLALASNAVGTAVAAARQLLLAARIAEPRAFLDPLVRASVDIAAELGAVGLTGPVVRGDLGTVDAHLRAIADDLPALLEAYRSLTAATLALVRPSLAPEVAEAIEVLVRGDGGATWNA
jgi:predicted short-subunit dehydrogenase-like oxidoreductase (DUF2520 family)